MTITALGIQNVTQHVQDSVHLFNKLDLSKETHPSDRSDFVMSKRTDVGSKFGIRLSKLLKARKLSVRSAAKIAGVAPSVIQSWKSGAVPQRFDRLKVLSEDGLDVSLTYLLTGEIDKYRKLSIDECFEDGEILFNGVARISIQSLVPKKGRKK